MKLSTRTRYGIRAMLELAENSAEGPLQIRTIAQRQDISFKYLEQLITILKSAGFVRSIRGAKGGYLLAKAANQIRLSDVFSAFTIYFDRPFEVGDYIVVGVYEGTVTKIGLKSTRVQLLRGEEMIISNHEITSGKVQNLRKMPRRRVELIVRVSPNVQLKKLKKIPSILKETIENCKPANFNMVHLREVGPFSYNFEVVYYLDTGDYNQFLDVQDQVNFAIRERFEKEGIDFGFQGTNRPQ